MWFRTSPSSELPQFLSPSFPANVSSSPLTCPSVGGQRQVDNVAVFTSPYPRRRKSGQVARAISSDARAAPAGRARAGGQRDARAPVGNRSCSSRALVGGQRHLRARPWGGVTFEASADMPSLEYPAPRPAHQVPGLCHKLT